MTKLHQAVRYYLSFPSHIKYEIIKTLGLEGNIDFNEALHEQDKTFFQTVNQLKLKERFIYEVNLVEDKRNGGEKEVAF